MSEPGLFERKVYELIGIDVRSLAVFRIGLGALLLADLVNRARDLN